VARLERLATDLQNNLIIQCGSFVGYVRWISARCGLRFDFKEFDHQAVFRVTGGKLVVDMDALQVEVMGRCNTSNASVEWRVISKEMERLLAGSDDLWQVCCGHDLTSLLVLYLRSCDIRVYRAQVEMDLSLTFDTLEFTGTQMYSRLVRWEDRNPDFPLLRRPGLPSERSAAASAL
jgi:hypothetical protein